VTHTATTSTNQERKTSWELDFNARLKKRSLANIGKLLRNVLGRGALDRPFPAYKGNDPDVFVCYAHDDEDFV
jgi:hypothetical protein